MNMPATDSALDVEELKHLALKAIQTDRDEDAIRLLKAGLAKAPKEGELLYLLGMVHSNLGMVARAIDEISQALVLSPGLINARFQLGLMHFTQRDFAQAEMAWRPLHSSLPENDALRVFATGLTQVGHNDLQRGIVTLERGIQRCGNAALNADMGRVVSEARRYLADAGQPAHATAGANGGTHMGMDADTQHVLLSGYARSREPN